MPVSGYYQKLSKSIHFMKFFAINEIPEDFQRWVKLFKRDMARFGLQNKIPFSLLNCWLESLKSNNYLEQCHSIHTDGYSYALVSKKTKQSFK